MSRHPLTSSSRSRTARTRSASTTPSASPWPAALLNSQGSPSTDSGHIAASTTLSEDHWPEALLNSQGCHQLIVVTLLQVQAKGVFIVCLRQMAIILRDMVMRIRLKEMDGMRLCINQIMKLQIMKLQIMKLQIRRKAGLMMVTYWRSSSILWGNQ